MDDQRLHLDNQLCFALYSTSLAMTQLYKGLLAPLGLTYPQFTIMLILWERDGVSLKYIAERLGQKSGALTPVIKRMASDDLILRIRGKSDDRMLSIELSDLGKNLKKQGLEVNQCIAAQCGLSQTEMVSLQQQLVSLRTKLQN